MIDEIDRALERWFRADVPLPVGDAEIKFDAPEETWDGRRTTPLVSVFLYSLDKSLSRAMNGSMVVQRDGGGLARIGLVPVIEARYLISVWGGGAAVEHELLGRLVNLLASSQLIPEEHQSPGMLAVSPQASISLAPDTNTSLTHLWSGLSVPPRPAIQLTVYSPMATPIPVPVPDPPSEFEFGVDRATPPAAMAQRRRVFGTHASVGAAPARKVRIEDSGREPVTRVEGGPVDD